MTGWLESPSGYGWSQRVLSRPYGRQRFIQRYLRPVEGERLLDLGCGPAHILDLLPPIEYCGLDSNPRYIEFARKRSDERATFVCADLCRTPWPVEGRFDRVLASGLLHHLPDEQAILVLENARKVLKPGGTLVTIDGCYEERQSPVARLLLFLDRGKYMRFQEGYEVLAQRVFPQVRAQIERELLRVPYSHLVMEMTG